MMPSVGAGGRVREYPAFVPFGDERLGAVLTVPNQPPGAVVILVTGAGGAPRSHLYAMWTRAARRIADRGLAAVRMEWLGVGDSTGRAIFPDGFVGLPTDQLATVADFALRATGTHRLGVAGNCLGARTALTAIDRLPACESLALILIKAAMRVRGRKPWSIRARALLARHPWLGRPVRTGYRALHSRGTDPVVEMLAAARSRTHIQVMENTDEKSGDLIGKLRAVAREPGPRRFEVTELPGEFSPHFESIERQAFVVEALADWFADTLADGPAPPGRRLPMAAGGQR